LHAIRIPTPGSACGPGAAGPRAARTLSRATLEG
jgi:hypothetical protein